MPRPTELRILGRKHAVRWVTPDDLDGCVGDFDPATKAIRVAASQHPIDEADTLLHETFHAILNAQGRAYGGKVEEVYVRALATGFIQVMRDNLAFVYWLQEKAQAPT